MSPKLILASKSKSRAQILTRLGVVFSQQSPSIDERSFSAQTPDALSLVLARVKARDVAKTNAEALVVGSDQVLVCEGEVLHQPNTADEAKAQLRHISSKTIYLHTSVAVCFKDSIASDTETCVLTLANLSDPLIERYVELDNPIGCVGAFKIEQRGGILMNSIKSGDHTGIEGLPVTLMVRLGERLGVSRDYWLG